MSFDLPATRWNGEPLDVVMTPRIQHWFCRSGVDYDDAVRRGVVTEAVVLALWNLRHDDRAGKNCAETHPGT